jgi:hypothetical protein
MNYRQLCARLNFRRWFYRTCPGCGRIDRLFGCWLPGHEDCIPF